MRGHPWQENTSGKVGKERRYLVIMKTLLKKALFRLGYELKEPNRLLFCYLKDFTESSSYVLHLRYRERLRRDVAEVMRG